MGVKEMASRACKDNFSKIAKNSYRSSLIRVSTVRPYIPHTCPKTLDHYKVQHLKSLLIPNTKSGIYYFLCTLNKEK